ncbi:MAG: acetyl-CoA carboxylase carboxyltransferase subunit alpha [Candidatus Eremiobacteraeota bacterium]|nr:acetyl-CoA carboxylase carboxyltransferase subunit alpha [Candidatus Eremiobacteraeota bacterium]
MILEVEKPLLELEEKIAELEKLEQSGVDLSASIRALKRQAEEIKHSIYNNLSPWDRVQIARHDQRPKTLDYIRELFTQFHELHGDRHYADDAAVVAGLARFEGRAVLVVGHQKGKDTKENLHRNFGMPAPEGFRKAQRLFIMAQRFKLPIITFVDTSGAYPGIEAEERGQYEAIASSIALMTELTVPIVTVVIGEGGSGGALGIAVGDRVLMLEHSVYSVISPEGCATILWRDASKAEQAAATLGLTSETLSRLGLVDEVIHEPLGGAHRDLAMTYKAVQMALNKHLGALVDLGPDDLVNRRYEKYRAMGRVQREVKV